MVATAAPYLDEELLLAGAELTWRAGAHREEKGAGLCHGTAGNGYALLKTFERTGDERWLERARRFAVHALAAGRAERPGRYSLFTGDVGVALFAACVPRGGCPLPGARRLGLTSRGWRGRGQSCSARRTRARSRRSGGGMFARLRDSLGRSRRALTEQIGVGRLRRGRRGVVGAARGGADRRRRGRSGDRRAGAAARGAADRRRRPDRGAAGGDRRACSASPPGSNVERSAERDPRRRRQRHRQDDHDRQARGRSSPSTAAPCSSRPPTRSAPRPRSSSRSGRSGPSADFVGSERGGDPAAVAFDAIAAAESRGRDVVVVDTAGRLHTQANLMEELAKVRRVIAPAAGGRAARDAARGRRDDRARTASSRRGSSARRST